MDRIIPFITQANQGFDHCSIDVLLRSSEIRAFFLGEPKQKSDWKMSLRFFSLLISVTKPVPRK